MSDSRPRSPILLAAAAAALALALLLSPSRAEAQFHVTAEVHQGIPIPLGAGTDWSPGFEVGGGLGFAIRGYDMLIGATLIGVNYASFHGDNLPYTRTDVTFLSPRILFPLKPILIGVQLGAGLRITEDGHNPIDVDPQTGEEITSYINFGLDIGPQIWWPINEYFALDATLLYQLSSNEIPDSFPDPRGSPRHGLVFRLGIVFAP